MRPPYPSDLSDAEFVVLAPHLPPLVGHGRLAGEASGRMAGLASG
jgi:hypothetical protein